MRSIGLFVLLVWPTRASAIDLSVAGDCPGSLTIDVTSFTGPDIAMFYAFAEGEDMVPLGPCGGTVLGLDGARYAFSVGDDDGDGRMRFRPTVSAGACRGKLQVLDLGTCEVSDVAPVSALADLPIVAADGRRGERGDGFYVIDLEAGTVELLSSGVPYTGLAYDASGNLWGVEANGRSYGDTNFYTIDPRTGEATLLHVVETTSCWSGMATIGDEVYHWAEWGADGDDAALDSLYRFDPVSGIDTHIYGGGASYGACLASDADGDMVRIAGMSLYSVDEEVGSEVYLGAITGIDTDLYSTGTGCTFHDGDLYLSATGWVSAYSVLYRVDMVTLAATDTGIAIPTVGWDAIASPTP